jgi:hypothetical protein
MTETSAPAEVVQAETLEQYADRIVAKTRRNMLDRLDDDVIGHLGKSHLVFGKACAMEAVWTAMREMAEGRAAPNTRPVASTLEPEVGDLADADEAVAAARAAGYRPENPTLWGAAVNAAHVAIARRRKAGLDPETVEACAKVAEGTLSVNHAVPHIKGEPLADLMKRSIALAIRALSPGKTGSAGVGDPPT